MLSCALTIPAKACTTDLLSLELHSSTLGRGNCDTQWKAERIVIRMKS